jgi:hypothetical protein
VQHGIRQAAEALQAGRQIEVAEQGHDAGGTKLGGALGVRRQGEQPVAAGETARDAQADVAAADDEQARALEALRLRCREGELGAGSGPRGPQGRMGPEFKQARAASPFMISDDPPHGGRLPLEERPPRSQRPVGPLKIVANLVPL